MPMYDLPDERGHFGPYGGLFVAETLIPALTDHGTRFIFDHRALQRWNIPLTALPPDSPPGRSTRMNISTRNAAAIA